MCHLKSSRFHKFFKLLPLFSEKFAAIFTYTCTLNCANFRINCAVFLRTMNYIVQYCANSHLSTAFCAIRCHNLTYCAICTHCAYFYCTIFYSIGQYLYHFSFFLTFLIYNKTKLNATSHSFISFSLFYVLFWHIYFIYIINKLVNTSPTSCLL